MDLPIGIPLLLGVGIVLFGIAAMLRPERVTNRTDFTYATRFLLVAVIDYAVGLALAAMEPGAYLSHVIESMTQSGTGQGTLGGVDTSLATVAAIVGPLSLVLLALALYFLFWSFRSFDADSNKVGASRVEGRREWRVRGYRRDIQQKKQEDEFGPPPAQ